MKKTIDLSIIIVEYKSGQALKRLRQALPKRKDWEVIVIDNGKKNIGYGAGCNAGAKKALGKYLLFLNPDVLIKETAIKKLLSYLKSHPKVGVVGPKFINAAGHTEICCGPHPTPLSSAIALSVINKWWPSNPVSVKFWVKDWDRETTRQMDAISGAALMVRAKEFAAVGGFDEGYFLYWEEYDLCKRYTLAGLTGAHVAEALAYHPRETSMKKSRLNLSTIFRQSRQLYFSKFFGLLTARVLALWLR